MKRALAILAIATCVAACGNAEVSSPTEVAQNYAYDLAEGNDPGACALLEADARAALIASTGARISCTRLLVRCLPNHSTQSSSDQSQLLYVNVDLRTQGARAEAALSGLPIARGIKQVSLHEERSTWRLTSPGAEVAKCARRLHAEDDRRRPRRASHG